MSNKNLKYSMNDDGQQYIDHFRYLKADQEGMEEVDELSNSKVIGYQLREILEYLPSLDLVSVPKRSKLKEELLERVKAKAEVLANNLDEDFERIVSPQDITMQNLNERNNQTHEMLCER